MKTEEKVINGVSYVIFGILLLICAFPFYYLVICTISDNDLVEFGKIFFIPRGIHFGNYVSIFKIQNLLSGVVISILRTVTGVIISVFVTAYMAYFFTKQEMWHRKFWYRFCIVTMYFSAGLIPAYLTNRMLGLTNSFWIYIIPSCLSVYNMVLIKTSIEALPVSLEESALLDGAGYIKRFFYIVMPLQKPILATIALFVAVHQWNDFFTTKVYITNSQLYPLQFILYEMLNQITSAAQQIQAVDPDATISTLGIRMTLTTVVVIPVMCIYPFVQKYFITGIMVGAVKG